MVFGVSKIKIAEWVLVICLSMEHNLQGSNFGCHFLCLLGFQTKGRIQIFLFSLGLSLSFTSHALSLSFLPPQVWWVSSLRLQRCSPLSLPPPLWGAPVERYQGGKEVAPPYASWSSRATTQSPCHPPKCPRREAGSLALRCVEWRRLVHGLYKCLFGHGKG